MFYEIRTYQLRTGTLPDYLRLVGEEGIELQKKHLGQLVGYFHTDIGPQNQIVHIWAYASLDEREARRAALAADPAWQAFAPRIQALIETLDNRILKPAPFSPLG
ncbi:NIPSNAP family protein [Derxia lacustris]|uniref:NIPSNAP family protein n=1 Tax=Derxia lacustris TaxID=764842 RepID=UPI000A177897|nr:NIPSNAP family protein [Derxia lacustris]